jgi:alkylation response protein AidB-like acyl-CoA dehydrogenase
MTSDTTPSAMRSALFWKSTGAVDHGAISSTVTAILWYAGHAFDAIPEEASVLACHVLAHVSEIGREIASVSTQVHGGIGWIYEQNLHFWYKRISSARHLLGGPESLRETAASLQSFGLAS